MATLTDSKKETELNNYLNPDFVFVPVPEGYKLKVENNQLVFKESPLAENSISSIVSPISGEVIGAKNCILSDGSIAKCIAIINDFKEKYEKRSGLKKRNNYSKEEIIASLKKRNAVSMQHLNEGIWDIFSNKPNAHTLLVSAIELDSRTLSNSFYIRDNIIIILDMIDLISETFGFKNSILAISSTDSANISKIQEFLGTYPKINLKTINGSYPIGLEHVLRKEICGSQGVAENVVFLSVADIIAIYNVLIREKYTTERIITITGDLVSSPVVVNVKIGSLIKPIIEELIKLKETDFSNASFLANDTISGSNLEFENLIVTHDLSAIIINHQKEIKSRPCINCGKCHEVCPVNINPKYIMDNFHDAEKLKASRVEKCLKCGLCTYKCPAHINLKQYLNKR